MIQRPSENHKPVTGLTSKLLGIVDELTKLMEEEAPLITARNHSRHNELIKRKQELTMDYQAILKVISEHPDFVNTLSEKEATTLRQSGKKLDAATQENAEAIRLAYHATERLLHVVMDEIRRDLHRESGYSGRGVMALAESGKSRSVAINQRV